MGIWARFTLTACITAILAPGAGAATLLVANKSDNTVDLLDPKSGESRATLPTGEAPHEVAVSPDGRWAVVSNYGSRDWPGSTLTVLDVVAGSVARTIDLGSHRRPHGLAWLTDTRMVVTAEGSAHLLVVDPHVGRVVAEIETAQRVSHMVAVTRSGRKAFVANIRSGSVTAIDLVEGRKLLDIRTGPGAEGIAVSPSGAELWVTQREADTLAIVDPDTLEVVATIPCPGFPIRIAFTPNGKRALVSCAGTGEIAIFDTAARKETLRRKLDLETVPEATSRLFGDRFGDSPVPVGLVVAPNGKTAWVAATQADMVVVVDTRTLEVENLMRAGKEPDGMAYSHLAPSKKKRKR